MQYITMSSKGQVVIPSQIRTDLALEEGDRMLITKEGNRIVLEPQRYRNLGEFFKSLPKAKKYISKSKINQILSRRAKERYEKGLRGHKHSYPSAN